MNTQFSKTSKQVAGRGRLVRNQRPFTGRCVVNSFYPYQQQHGARLTDKQRESFLKPMSRNETLAAALTL